jgi:tyrosine-protein phosphatase SIW14
MNAWLQRIWGVTLVVATGAVPAWWAWHENYHYRNFREVEPAVLYRSGQMTPAGLARMWHQYGFGTVVSLRDHDGLSEQVGGQFWEQSWCAAQDVVFVRIPPRSWWSARPAEEPPPAAAAVKEFLRVIHDPQKHPRPILLHCFAGTHRTGVFQAIWRMEVDRWTNTQAIAELRRNGYDTLDRDADVKDFLERYVPTWKTQSKTAHKD